MEHSTFEEDTLTYQLGGFFLTNIARKTIVICVMQEEYCKYEQ